MQWWYIKPQPVVIPVPSITTITEWRYSFTILRPWWHHWRYCQSSAWQKSPYPKSGPRPRSLWFPNQQLQQQPHLVPRDQRRERLSHHKENCNIGENEETISWKATDVGWQKTKGCLHFAVIIVNKILQCLIQPHSYLFFSQKYRVNFLFLLVKHIKYLDFCWLGWVTHTRTRVLFYKENKLPPKLVTKSMSCLQNC